MRLRVECRERKIYSLRNTSAKTAGEALETTVNYDGSKADRLHPCVRLTDLLIPLAESQQFAIERSYIKSALLNRDPQIRHKAAEKRFSSIGTLAWNELTYI